MPFTGSHPALIIPLLKNRYFSASGLIMGSMVPDFEFILLMKTSVVYGHDISSMFWLNLPLSIGLLFLFHNVVRKSMILNLPGYFEKRLRSYLYFNWNGYFRKNIVKVMLSILLGNLGHLFWDAFTHQHGIFVEWIGFLATPVMGVPLYHVLQYGFSLLGAWALWLFFRKLPFKDLYPSDKRKMAYWAIVGAVAVVVLFFRFREVQRFYFEEWVVCSLSAFMIGLVAASVLDRLNAFNKGRARQVKPVNVEVGHHSGKR
ncbi:DUF4184 family protein [Pseudozobellia thermophila]|uniref:DUF4184 family protein n=1 Tax=Pseudozobellia thermophila TaxID=192903 RepID=A0A1M6C606_9FLAO|nr:DUF4184 family protein [Pseudozobellia thermophila]SHI56446.1 protein of unknown function [Pseudozobellia thermophila]